MPERADPSPGPERGAAPRPFFAPLRCDVRLPSDSRARITADHRLPETQCIPRLLRELDGLDSTAARPLADRLVQGLRRKGQDDGLPALMREYSLSSQEGVALMCVAEALLRIPDGATRDALIRDKLGQGDWLSHLGAGSLFANAAAWGLAFSGRLVQHDEGDSWPGILSRLISRTGEPVVRRAVALFVGMLGQRFVAGVSIEDALRRSRRTEAHGFRHSYDMLGEAALTADEARRYQADYETAIHVVGVASSGLGVRRGAGVSIKLSALHPRYCRAQRERVMAELYPQLLHLMQLARRYDIGVNIDAEESDRLDLSLDLLERLCREASLAGWEGLGFVVQAYQKRALGVIEHVIGQARSTGRTLMLRLVKGAYWDSEIKRAQLDGMPDYPVYTRKMHTDVSYLACARKLLEARDVLYPQFATHNPLTLATVYEMAGGAGASTDSYEFQCLHGMGDALYEQVVAPLALGGLGRPCRIYAPVGSHDRLLAYLVRRLLENGANTSFVHQFGDPRLDMDQLLADPVVQASGLNPVGAPHPRIPLPRDLYRSGDARLNSRGLDLADEAVLQTVAQTLAGVDPEPMQASPEDEIDPVRTRYTWFVLNPGDHRDLVGKVHEADMQDVEHAVRAAVSAGAAWASQPVAARADCLLRAAQALEVDAIEFAGMVVREAGKTLPAALAEVREAVDCLRYYASRAQALPGDACSLGPVACISPWNFPLAIFLGQVAAALAAGNTVLAKPAEQTCLVGAMALRLLHDAGVPKAAAHLLPGRGETVGAQLVAHPGVQGVLFTGSTEVARRIAGVLAQRLSGDGHTIPLVAETGGINAMVVDSSALPEQAVSDILVSAFDSAGQRCSALRLLCIQEECADDVLSRLRGAMGELRVGPPGGLDVDVGPVIDEAARDELDAHLRAMRGGGLKVEQVKLAQDCRWGTFVAPALIHLNGVEELQHEVFGPVLHVVRYRRDTLDALVRAINAKGYGLTFGVHTRLDGFAQNLVRKVRAGNHYVNRNMIGAVVGVQPFGGDGLSGTGPKAGGPLYLHRLVRMGRGPDIQPERAEHTLPGPTGQRDLYRLEPRGTVLCMAQTVDGARRQFDVCMTTGNHAVFLESPASRRLLESCPDLLRPRLGLVSDSVFIDVGEFQAVLFEGDARGLMSLNQRLAGRVGRPIVQAQGLSSREVQEGAHYVPDPLLREVSVSWNTAAAGGNASLLMLD